ncbi:MAG: HAD-IA family hydrolase, partial [Proteobacteria bacterium]|nr:HAD-IA family hydrolase [Pseudomonadota bacterium]
PTEAETTFKTLDADAFAWSRKFDGFDEYSADFAIGTNRAISDVVMRRRTRTSGGFAVISESVDDAALNQLFSRLATALADAGGLGCFNAQVIAPRDAEVAPFISDINPRLGTSATHALAEGINLPGFFIASAQAHATPVTRRPIKNVRLLQDLPLPRLARRPRGLVLDLDDTLVDHKRWLFAKMERLHAECFRAHVDASAWQLATAQLIDEHDWPRLIDRTLEVLSLPTSLRDRAIAAYRAIEVDTPVFDDVEPALAALTQAGIRLAILTDNPPATQRAKLAHAPGLRHIEKVVFARECGGEKPGAAVFDAAAQALALQADELIMVGDNWFRDGVGALRAGYAHALVVRRYAAAGNTDRWRRSATPPEVATRIHAVPDLTCVQHTCLDAPA